MPKTLAHFKIGFPSGAKEPDSGETLIDIAKTHEFGNEAKGIPERSFLRAGMREGKKELEEHAKELLVSYFEGEIPKRQIGDALAETGIGLIREKIASKIAPPLSDAAIRARLYRRKGYPRIRPLLKQLTTSQDPKQRKAMARKIAATKKKREAMFAAEKASATPLIDTGALIGALDKENLLQ